MVIWMVILIVMNGGRVYSKSTNPPWHGNLLGVVRNIWWPRSGKSKFVAEYPDDFPIILSHAWGQSVNSIRLTAEIVNNRDMAAQTQHNHRLPGGHQVFTCFFPIAQVHLESHVSTSIAIPFPHVCTCIRHRLRNHIPSKTAYLCNLRWWHRYFSGWFECQFFVVKSKFLLVKSHQKSSDFLNRNDWDKRKSRVLM